ncbi:MAG: aminotransferase class V-fold PLP-dependent enzyme [Gemmatimonadetes bacterium]|nr:aminotransferase class V-fold PLP-dependent enzyme [Gemmatimonadota bacterium]
MDAAALKEQFEALRAQEFHRLDEGGHAYLDYTGSGLYAESQLRRHIDIIERQVFGNPHSVNPTSSVATRLMEEARQDVLRFFDADPAEYTVVFTNNASGALKLVGEAFPFGPESRFVLLRDNHNSVHGMRIYAERRGAQVVYLRLDAELRLDPDAVIPPAGSGPSLFAFPAQSNFSGVQHSLGLAEKARSLGYQVVLDAAAFAPTNRLDLGSVDADFVCLSFYKMFGYPTGVGALIARREALARLQRPWFAGGTVDFVSVEHRVHQLRNDASAFEDGTPDFLGIAAVPVGLDFLRSVGTNAVHERVVGLTARLLEILASARHGNGSPKLVRYGPAGLEARGGTVTFNLLDAEGRLVPYEAVEESASNAGISLRGGCFCNPGAAEAAFGLASPEMLDCLRSMPPGTFTLPKLATCLDHKYPVGGVRASVGVATTEADLDRLEGFLASFDASEAAKEQATAAG